MSGSYERADIHILPHFCMPVCQPAEHNALVNVCVESPLLHELPLNQVSLSQVHNFILTSSVSDALQTSLFSSCANMAQHPLIVVLACRSLSPC